MNWKHWKGRALMTVMLTKTMRRRRTTAAAAAAPRTPAMMRTTPSQPSKPLRRGKKFESTWILQWRKQKATLTRIQVGRHSVFLFLFFLLFFQFAMLFLGTFMQISLLAVVVPVL